MYTYIQYLTWYYYYYNISVINLINFFLRIGNILIKLLFYFKYIIIINIEVNNDANNVDTLYLLLIYAY
jgi:hypothetical protein